MFKTSLYQSEAELPEIMALIEKDLSEPYTVYTYRYFIHQWPKLCYIIRDNDKMIGVVIAKLEQHSNGKSRGYIGMLAIDQSYRKQGLGSQLVKLIMANLQQMGAQEVICLIEIVLETEANNLGALRLYERLGFVRDKKLTKYYLNGIDAFRLKLWL
jgi:peptide alpha-N-acetyltransferase